LEPVRNYSALVDLLDHALQKGLYVSADVIISVADVPLIGLNLRLALANIQTMFNYGLMRDWDEARRSMDQEKCSNINKIGSGG
jgi:gas vesicle structural protein